MKHSQFQQRTMLRYRYLFIFTLSVHFFWFSCPHHAFAQQDVITLDAPESGEQEHIARQKVEMTAGYSYSSTNGDKMHAEVDPSLPEDIVYQSMFDQTNFDRSIDESKAVGATVGTYAVSPSGAATYSIPIAIPEGTMGMQPSVSLSYNSQGGNGQLGRGWSLGGTSSIVRVTKNLFYDGEVAPITSGIEDEYALDGNRLVLQSGTHGQNGAVYYTHMETFSRITAQFSDAYGPHWFKVEMKNGLTYEYGKSDDAKFLFEGNPTSVMVWRLNKVYDCHGNYMDYIYKIEDRESRLDRIEYTGNTTAGLAPYNTIKFHYDYREDENTGYIAGSEINSKFLLTRIHVITNGNDTYRDYDLSYGFDGLHSYFHELHEKGSDGSEYNSTRFKYGDVTTSFNEVQTNLTHAGTPGSDGTDIFNGDFNGDGLTDILLADYESINGLKVHTKIILNVKVLANDDQFVPLGNPYILNQDGVVKYGRSLEDNEYYNFLISDFNGDGQEDLIIYEMANFNSQTNSASLEVVKLLSYNLQTSTWDETNYQPSTTYKWYNLSEQPLILGDFDGDSRMDFITNLAVLAGAPNNYELRFTSPGLGETNKVVVIVGANPQDNPYYWAKSSKIFAIDMEGDGKNEILVVRKESTSAGIMYGSDIYSIEKNGSIYEAKPIYSSGFPTEWHTLWPGDFNGDRKTDLLTYVWDNDNNIERWDISISTGLGFEMQNFTWNFNPLLDANHVGLINNGKIIISDFDGNGKTDISYYYYILNGGVQEGNLDTYFGSGSSFKYVHEDIDPTNFGWLSTGDFNGDSKSDAVFRESVIASEPAIIHYFNEDAHNHRITSILNGINFKTDFAYAKMSDFAVYQHTTAIDPNFPIIKTKFPFQLVKTISVPDGLEGTRDAWYTYYDAYFHRQAKGFLGFGSIELFDVENEFTTLSANELNEEYSLLYPYSTQTSYDPTGTINDITTSFTTSDIQIVNKDIAQQKRYWMKTIATSTTDNLKDITVNSSFTYDDNDGNLTYRLIDNGGLETIETTYSDFNNTCSWLPNKAETVTVTKKRLAEVTPDDPSFSYTTKIVYDGTHGAITSKISFWGEPKALTTTYSDFDAFGNPGMTQISAQGLTPRQTTYLYDSKGRSIIRETNALNQYRRISYDPILLRPVMVTDIDGLNSSITYDGFGRELELTDTKGKISKTIRNWNVYTGDNTKLDEVSNSIYRVEKHIDGLPNEYTWFDVMGQIRKTEVELVNGEWSRSVSLYNKEGIMMSSTLPFKAGDLHVAINNLYDEHNRLKSSTTGSLFPVTIDYEIANGNFKVVQTVKDESGTPQVKYSLTDDVGKLIESGDEGGDITYRYFHHGGQKEVEVNNEIVASMTYDPYGRQETLQDPNAGTTGYVYNAYGELESQIDSKGNTTQIFYDILGRQDYRSITEGTVDYSYVAEGNGLNLISKISGPDGVEREFIYDDYSRIKEIREDIVGTTYTHQYQYDNFDNLTKETYPSGLIMKYKYDDPKRGYLYKIVNNAETVTYYETIEMNAFGQVTKHDLGNGTTCESLYNQYGVPDRFKTIDILDLDFTFDNNVGNLTQRHDHINSLTEVFTYDKINRLTSAKVGSNPTLSMTYEAGGNIESKSDVSSNSYVYDANKIHAVAEISNPSTVIPSATQSITYNSAQQPESITDAINKSLEFTYGPEFSQRSRMDYFEDDAAESLPQLLESRYYLGNYEQRRYNLNVPSGSTQDIHYVSGNGLNMIVVKEDGVYTYYYTYTDYLGSILTVTDDQAVIVHEQNFDAWGRRRNPGNWTYSGIANAPDWLYRGYTGHEHLQEDFKTINMNGRLYDPLVGRMLSVDNYVSDPTSTQGYNRYSYVINNPLSYTDPDGEFAWFAVAIGAAVNYMVQAFQGNLTTTGKAFGAVVVGGASGAAGFGAGSALGLGGVGFLNGAATGAVGGAAGSFVGGTGNAWLGGASFGQGLGAGFRGAGLGALTGGAIGGISGGLYATKHGGNFWNGDGATFDLLATGHQGDGNPVEYSNGSVRSFSKEHFGDVQGLKEVYADGTVAKGYTAKDGIIYNKAGNAVDATTAYYAKGNYSKVFFSKTSFVSKEYLYLTMGHEYMHVAYNYAGYSHKGLNKTKHAAIFKWQADQAKLWGHSSYSKWNLRFNLLNKAGHNDARYDFLNFPLLNTKPW